MGFNYQKFDRIASLGTLSGLGCSRAVLKNAACRYGIASILPGEKREALRQSRISHKQLKAKAAEAGDLAGFLRRLENSPRITVANDMPTRPIPVWCRDLEGLAHWIESLLPFRPDAKSAALALAMHVRRRTGKRHLPEIRRLLNAALTAAGLPADLTVVALTGQIKRANRRRADEMLRSWESLVPAKKPQN